MTNNILNPCKIYLAGPIDRAADDGVGWRNQFKSELGLECPHIEFFDPCDKPKKLGSEIGTEKRYVQDQKSLGNYNLVRERVREFRRYDLRMIDHSHAFVIYVDTEVHMCGSYNELHFAEQAHKPRFAILPQGIANAPD